MKVGDFVRNLNSEFRMTGVVVGWHQIPNDPIFHPQVWWADGRYNWIVRHRAEVVK